MNRNYQYSIQVYVKEQKQWAYLGERFRRMKGKFAEGAWATLITFTSGKSPFRLICVETGFVEGRQNYSMKDDLDKAPGNPNEGVKKAAANAVKEVKEADRPRPKIIQPNGSKVIEFPKQPVSDRSRG